MINRRNLLRLAAGTVLAPGTLASGLDKGGELAWEDFRIEMLRLASAYLDKRITQQHMMARGLELMQQLDTSDAAFHTAVQTSWETGNRYWLWQRLIREAGVTGGILVIDHGQIVPMHDHPGATGMVRVLKGEVEVWHYDRSMLDTTDRQVLLNLVTHRILLPGDIAVLSPERGNIHALRSHSKSCHMLDYFIPPYERSKRTWYLPVDDDWHERDQVICRSVHENDFYMS